MMVKENLLKLCDWCIEISFYGLLFTVTFSISFVEIFSMVMMVSWGIKRVIRRDLLSFDSWPVRILFLYFLWAVLSCINTQYWNESFRGILKVGEYSLLFLVCYTETGRSRFATRSFYVIAATTLITCINGIFQYFSGYDFIRHRTLISEDYLHRISSSFVHPNDYGTFLVVVSVLLLSVLISRSSTIKRKVFLLPVIVISLLNLYLTDSRGSWLAFVGAILVLGALKGRKVLGVFIIILLVGVILLPGAAQERMLDLFDFEEGTSWERVMLWKGAVNMIKVHPVLGFGINTYSRNFPDYKPVEYPDLRYTHNSYLQMATEIGLVGMLLFIGFLIVTFIYAARGARRMPVGGVKDITMGLLAGAVGFSLSSMVDTHLHSVVMAVFFSLVSGFCYSLSCRFRA